MKVTRFLAAGLLGLSLAAPVFAGSPYNVDDPGTTEAHHYQISLAYVSSQVQGSESQSVPVSFSYGLNNTTELDLGLGLASARATGTDRQTGFGDVTPGIRWRFLEETKRRPQVGLAYVLKIPTADKDKGLGSGAYDHTAYAMAAKSFGKAFVFANAGYAVLGAEGARDNWFYGVGATYQTTEKWTVGAQLYGNTPTATDGRNELAWGVGATCNYAPNQAFVVQVGRSLRGLSDLNVYAGLQFTFGPLAKP